MEYYRVQVCAFKNLKDANKVRSRLNSDGYKTYMSHVDVYYKVEVGDYVDKQEAFVEATKLRVKRYQNIVKNKGYQQIISVVRVKNIGELALEVVANEWGLSNETIRHRLYEAGYDFDKVQRRIEDKNLRRNSKWE